MKKGQGQDQAVYVKVQHEQIQWFLKYCVDSSFLDLTPEKYKKQPTNQNKPSKSLTSFILL